MAKLTDEELEARLVSQFEAYMKEVVRLAKGATARVKAATNTLRLNGYSLNDLLAIIRSEVKKHEDDLNNPHTETLTSLQGMSSADYEVKALNYFPKDALPISQYPTLTMAVSGNQITVAASTVLYMGRNVSTPRVTLGPMAAINQYLKLTITGKQPDRVATYTLSGDDSESISTVIVGVIKYNAGVWTPSPIACTRIGGARLSYDPHGQSIPYSGGTQAAPGSIHPGWIG